MNPLKLFKRTNTASFLFIFVLLKQKLLVRKKTVGFELVSSELKVNTLNTSPPPRPRTCVNLVTLPKAQNPLKLAQTWSHCRGVSDSSTLLMKFDRKKPKRNFIFLSTTPSFYVQLNSSFNVYHDDRGVSTKNKD